MSLFIKDRSMPKNCKSCPMMTGTFCDILNIDVDPFYNGAISRNDNCPLIEIKPHGDLIDRDDIMAFFPDCYSTLKTAISVVCAAIYNMPPIIEAEGAEE